MTDHLGTPLEMYDQEGTKQWEVQLDSYGAVRQGVSKIGDCPFRYQGQYEDTETGLYYNRFRYYSPVEGMYLSQDPIGLDGGFNLYQFSPDTNDYIDPLGLAYRRKNGQFGKKPGRKPKPKSSVHGNSKTSTKPAVLYAMKDGNGVFQKWGITNETVNPRNRYRNTIPKDWEVVEMTRGTRSDMLKLERELTEKMPGPLNKEPWAGSKSGQVLGADAQKIKIKCG